MKRGVLFLALIAAGLLALGRGDWLTQPYLAGFFLGLLPVEGAFLLGSLERSREGRAASVALATGLIVALNSLLM